METERKENEVQKWEYKTAELAHGLIEIINGNKIPSGQRLSLEDLLTKWGAEGWNLATSLAEYHGLGAILVFKRPAHVQTKDPAKTP